MVAARFFVASGEAALVRGRVAADGAVQGTLRRHRAVGVFFMGIPIGLGLAFVLAGVLGSHIGWRGSFYALGVMGVVIGVPALLLKDDRAQLGETDVARPSGSSCATCSACCAATPPWPARCSASCWCTWPSSASPRAAVAGARTRPGCGGDGAEDRPDRHRLRRARPVVGGVLSDRLALPPGGHAGFVVLLILVCGPLMVAYRFADAGSGCSTSACAPASSLPLATYGPSLALIQGLTPDAMRSTVTGMTMLLINVFAIAIGNR